MKQTSVSYEGVKRMVKQTEQRENFSPGIKELLEQKDFSGTHEVQRRLQEKIHSREVQTEYPLERVLTIIQDHKREALGRHISRDGLTNKSQYLGEDGFIEGKSPDTQRLTTEILGVEDFSYSTHEASIVGGYLRNTFGEFGCEIAIDRIVLRYALNNVEDHQTREVLWHSLTTYGDNMSFVKSLEKDHGKEEAKSIVREIETTVLPAYAELYDDLFQSPERIVRSPYMEPRVDRGIALHEGVISLRARFLVSVIEAAKHRMNYEQGDMSAYYRQV